MNGVTCIRGTKCKQAYQHKWESDYNEKDKDIPVEATPAKKTPQKQQHLKELKSFVLLLYLITVSIWVLLISN